jgi:AraC family transcriptional regulator
MQVSTQPDGGRCRQPTSEGYAMQLASLQSSEPLCRPRTTSFFQVEHQIATNGIHVDIRNFGWDNFSNAAFESTAHYIDYSLIPRSTLTKLSPAPGRDAKAPGEIVFLPKGSAFHAQCAPSKFRLLCLTFEGSRADSVFAEDVGGNDIELCLDVRSVRVRQLLALLAEEVLNPGFASDILIETTALSLAVELCRHFQEVRDEPRAGIADWRLQRLRERIESAPDEPIAVADLAALCGMSPRHLIRTFKKTTGTTLGQFIADVRINHAKRELEKSDVRIKSVANCCGFQSAAAFSASFRRATGLTPKQYREQRLS